MVPVLFWMVYPSLPTGHIMLPEVCIMLHEALGQHYAPLGQHIFPYPLGRGGILYHDTSGKGGVISHNFHMCLFFRLPHFYIQWRHHMCITLREHQTSAGAWRAGA